MEQKQSFTDRFGNSWQVEITYGTFKKCKQVLGIDLTEMADVRKLSAFLGDLVNFVDCLYLCCEGQCKESSMDDEGFGQIFDGDSLRAAQEAWIEAYANFGLPAGEKRSAFRRLIKALQGMTDRLILKTDAEIAELEKLDGEKVFDLLTASSNGQSTAAQESSA